MQSGHSPSFSMGQTNEKWIACPFPSNCHVIARWETSPFVCFWWNRTDQIQAGVTGHVTLHLVPQREQWVDRLGPPQKRTGHPNLSASSAWKSISPFAEKIQRTPTLYWLHVWEYLKMAAYTGLALTGWRHRNPVITKKKRTGQPNWSASSAWKSISTFAAKIQRTPTLYWLHVWESLKMAAYTVFVDKSYEITLLSPSM